jgi:hypothetical protein
MPAIVAFQSKLWILGNTPDTYEMWSATMTADEVLRPLGLRRRRLRMRWRRRRLRLRLRLTGGRGGTLSRAAR